MIKENQFNKTLLGIIEENQYTEYGRKYHFDYFRTVDGYRYVVPLVEYKDVQPYIELTTRIGEQRIYVKNKLIAYTLTSGTTEINHYVPCTQKHIDPYVKEFKNILSQAGGGDNIVLFESIPHKIIYSDRAKLDTITGIILQQLKPSLDKYHITSPEDILFREDPSDITYYRTLFAVNSNKAVQIIAPFTWSVVSMINCILDNKEKLIRDLRNGTVTFNDKISDALRSNISKTFTANPGRADELEAVLNTADHSDLLKKIWPKLSRIVAAGSGPFKIYTDNLRKYSKGIQLSNGFYACSEGIIGKAVSDNEYELYQNESYIEFKEPDSDGNKTVLYDEVEPGKEYLVYITNNAGLYRYNIRDIVKITRVENGIPYFEYVRRQDESKAEELIYQGIKKISAAMDVYIEDFCYSRKSDGKLTIYIETKNPDAVMNNKESIINCFDSTLNVDNIQIISLGSQNKYKRIRGIGGNMAADQLKPIRNLNDKDKEAFFGMFMLE